MKFNFSITGIGSVPYIESKKAVQLVLKYIKDIPFWPQLPLRSFLEGMGPQFSRGLPALVINERENLFYLDTDCSQLEKEASEFYERYLDGDTEFFAISPDYAKGFYEMVDQIQAQKLKPLYIKGQITGPLTFGSLVTDKEGRSIMHDQFLSDVLIKNLIMKARWQIKEINEMGLKSIIFLDEPYLMGYGSAFVPLDSVQIVRQLTEVIEAIHQDGALAGIHCCGNTDWAMIMETPVDIVNFDAYAFMDKFVMYADRIKKYILRGGIIAWGIVPSVMLNLDPDVKELSSRLEKGLKELVKKGVSKEMLMSQSILTPSCGLGGLSEFRAEERLKMLVNLSEVDFHL